MLRLSGESVREGARAQGPAGELLERLNERISSVSAERACRPLVAYARAREPLDSDACVFLGRPQLVRARAGSRRSGPALPGGHQGPSPPPAPCPRRTLWDPSSPGRLRGEGVKGGYSASFDFYYSCSFFCSRAS